MKKKRRVRITMQNYNELREARQWCALNGMNGMRQFYDELLSEHMWRRTLPAGASEYEVEEARPSGRDR